MLRGDHIFGKLLAEFLSGDASQTVRIALVLCDAVLHKAVDYRHLEWAQELVCTSRFRLHYLFPAVCVLANYGRHEKCPPRAGHTGEARHEKREVELEDVPATVRVYAQPNMA